MEKHLILWGVENLPLRENALALPNSSSAATRDERMGLPLLHEVSCLGVGKRGIIELQNG